MLSEKTGRWLSARRQAVPLLRTQGKIMTHLPFSMPPPDPDDLTVALRYVQLTSILMAAAAVIAGLTA